MRGKVIGIVCALLVLAAVLFGNAYNNGFNQTTTNNPMSQFESISELQRSVQFKFQVPTIVAKEKNIRLFNYLNNMIEIQSDSFTFRAAPFVADGADVSGDYTAYNTDEKYISEDEAVLARYRASDSATLINLMIQDMTYSMKFESALNEKDAFSKLDIDITEFKEYTEETKDETNNEEDKDTEGELLIGVVQDGEIQYTLIENEEMQVSFMLPKVKSDVKTVANNNQLAVMIADKVVITIEHYKDGYTAEEFKGYTLKELSDKYLIRYIVDNTFAKESQQYKDYYTIIENIDTIAKTFNTEN